MIYVKLVSGAEFSFDGDNIEVKAENCHIIIYICSNQNSIYTESKYFFPIKDIQIFQTKE